MRSALLCLVVLVTLLVITVVDARARLSRRRALRSQIDRALVVRCEAAWQDCEEPVKEALRGLTRDTTEAQLEALLCEVRGGVHCKGQSMEDWPRL